MQILLGEKQPANGIISGKLNKSMTKESLQSFETLLYFNAFLGCLYRDQSELSNAEDLFSSDVLQGANIDNVEKFGLCNLFIFFHSWSYFTFLVNVVHLAALVSAKFAIKHK